MTPIHPIPQGGGGGGGGIQYTNTVTFPGRFHGCARGGKKFTTTNMKYFLLDVISLVNNTK